MKAAPAKQAPAKQAPARQTSTGRQRRGAKPVTASSDLISDFFRVLAEPGHLATFEGESATLRFDVSDGRDTQRWHVTVDDGETTVTRRNSPADVVVRVSRDRMEQLVTGRLNAQAAMLRGLITCEGSAAAAIMFQRCLPGPAGSTGRVAPMTSTAVMARARPSGSGVSPGGSSHGLAPAQRRTK